MSVGEALAFFFIFFSGNFFIYRRKYQPKKGGGERGKERKEKNHVQWDIIETVPSSTAMQPSFSSSDRMCSLNGVNSLA